MAGAAERPFAASEAIQDTRLAQRPLISLSVTVGVRPLDAGLGAGAMSSSGITFDGDNAREAKKASRLLAMSCRRAEPTVGQTTAS